MGDPNSDLPPGKVTKFDKASYVKLTSFVDDVNLDMDSKFLKPTSGVELTSDVGAMIHPGSPDWTPAATVSKNAGTFGGSVHDQLSKMSTEWSSYVNSLKKATSVFDNTDDLATMSATDFEGKYPGLSNGTGSTT